MNKITTSNSKFNILIPLVNIAIFYCILFPADKINIKEILFLIPIILYFIIDRSNRAIPLYVFGYGILYTIITITYSLVRGTEIAGAISYGYVWLFLLMVPLTVKYRINPKKCFFYATYSVALIIDFIFLSDMFHVFSITSNPLAVFFLNMNEIQGLGKGIFSTFGYSIYYKSCTLVLITYSYLIYRKKYVLSIPLIVSMLACGARANFLVALFLTASVPILCGENISKQAIAVLIIFSIGILLLPSIVDKITHLNALKYSRSGSIKWADVYVIFDNMKYNMVNFLFGTGVGSTFRSPRGQDMSTFEFSYIDYLRQAGILGLIVFVSFIIRPMKWLFNNERWLFLSLIGYLLVAATNPLLVTSSSFMLYLLVYHDFESAADK